MVLIIIFLIVIIVILIIVNTSSKAPVSKNTSNFQNHNYVEEKREEIRKGMRDIGVQALTTVEMNDSEKDQLFNYALDFFKGNFIDIYDFCLEEMATQAYTEEIERFSSDVNLKFRIAERYQKYLKQVKPFKFDDYGFDDLKEFSSYFRDNFNEESKEYQREKLRKEFIEIASNTLLSTDITSTQRESLFQELINSFQEHFPDCITKCLEDTADVTYRNAIERFTIDENFNSKIKVRYNQYLKAKRPLQFSDYGFTDIHDFTNTYAVIENN